MFHTQADGNKGVNSDADLFLKAAASGTSEALLAEDELV